jgi:hypothetical protein
LNDVDDQASEQESLDLDPFAFIPEAASRIPGLGGDMPPADPTYAFHTPYVAVARGTVNFNLQFHNLQARRGTLTLRVHMLPDEPGSIARLVNSERIQLNRLVAQGGHISVSTEGFRGVTYALVGAIPDASDVTADGLSISLDRQQDRHEQRAALADVRSTSFGNALFRPSPHLLAAGAPRFDQPMSQPFTDRQMKEPGFVGRLGALGTADLDDMRRWEMAYAIQVLDSYGMLAEGSRGLALISSPSAIPAMVASAGPAVHVIVQSDSTLAQCDAETIEQSLNYPSVCSREVMQERSTISVLDAFQLPQEVVNLDFLWTEHLCNKVDPGGAITFLDEVIDRLRPGGLSIHMMDADLDFSGKGYQIDSDFIYGRGDIERLALSLVSRGHEVARLRPGIDMHKASRRTRREPGGRRPFVLVVRRARSPI